MSNEKPEIMKTEFSMHEGSSSISQPAISETIAEVSIKVFGLEKNKSEIQVWISSGGPLANGLGIGKERADAYAQLLAIIDRELKEAFSLLGNA